MPTHLRRLSDNLAFVPFPVCLSQPRQLDKPLASSNLLYCLALLGLDPAKDKPLLSWCCGAFVSQVQEANSQVRPTMGGTDSQVQGANSGRWERSSAQVGLLLSQVQPSGEGNNVRGQQVVGVTDRGGKQSGGRGGRGRGEGEIPGAPCKMVVHGGIVCCGARTHPHTFARSCTHTHTHTHAYTHTHAHAHTHLWVCRTCQTQRTP